MLYREYEKFYNYINKVTKEEFTLAAKSANFVDDTFINIMWNEFNQGRLAFLFKNKEGLMFNYFYDNININ